MNIPILSVNTSTYKMKWNRLSFFYLYKSYYPGWHKELLYNVSSANYSYKSLYRINCIYAHTPKFIRKNVKARRILYAVMNLLFTKQQTMYPWTNFNIIEEGEKDTDGTFDDTKQKYLLTSVNCSHMTSGTNKTEMFIYVLHISHWSTT